MPIYAEITYLSQVWKKMQKASLQHSDRHYNLKSVFPTPQHNEIKIKTETSQRLDRY